MSWSYFLQKSGLGYALSSSQLRVPLLDFHSFTTSVSATGFAFPSGDILASSRAVFPRDVLKNASAGGWDFIRKRTPWDSSSGLESSKALPSSVSSYSSHRALYFRTPLWVALSSPTFHRQHRQCSLKSCPLRNIWKPSAQKLVSQKNPQVIILSTTRNFCVSFWSLRQPSKQRTLKNYAWENDHWVWKIVWIQEGCAEQREKDAGPHVGLGVHHHLWACFGHGQGKIWG